MASCGTSRRCHRGRSDLYPRYSEASGDFERDLRARHRRGCGVRRRPMGGPARERRHYSPLRPSVPLDPSLRRDQGEAGARVPQHHSTGVLLPARRRARPDREPRTRGAPEPGGSHRARPGGLGVQPGRAPEIGIREDRCASHSHRLRALSRARAERGRGGNARRRTSELSLRGPGLSQQAVRGSGEARLLLQEIRFREFSFPPRGQGG